MQLHGCTVVGSWEYSSQFRQQQPTRNNRTIQPPPSNIAAKHITKSMRNVSCNFVFLFVFSFLLWSQKKTKTKELQAKRERKTDSTKCRPVDRSRQHRAFVKWSTHVVTFNRPVNKPQKKKNSNITL